MTLCAAPTGTRFSVLGARGRKHPLSRTSLLVDGDVDILQVLRLRTTCERLHRSSHACTGALFIQLPALSNDTYASVLQPGSAPDQNGSVWLDL